MIKLRRPRIEYKTPPQLAAMRRSGLLLARLHDHLEAHVEPGITTAELDQCAVDFLAQAGSRSNFLGYHGYPASICTSVNDVIVHGIPNDTPLVQGDVVSIDAGCIVDGWHSDAARTHIVGELRNQDDFELVHVTRNAMWAGIAALATATHVGDIGAAIEEHVQAAVGDALATPEDFGGHGIGSAMHQPPDVMNFRTRDRGPRIRPGMCLAIEPMLVQGDASYVVEDDDWTVRATSGGRSAHVEHSVAVTEHGIYVLTAHDGGAEELSSRNITIAPEPVD